MNVQGTVFDEATFLSSVCNDGNKGAKTLKEIAEGSFKILLTGTPRKGRMLMNDIMHKRRYEPPSPAPEVQAKLDMAARETINLSMREIRCPRCRFIITKVYSDVSGHFLAKCPKCKGQYVINFAYFRTQKEIWKRKCKYYGKDYLEKLNHP